MTHECDRSLLAPERFEEGVQLFNRQEYYLCHDVIEEIWLEESSDQRLFLQGIIQSAVAFYHFQNGKLGASRSMLGLAIEKLDGYDGPGGGLDLPALLEDLRVWKAALDSSISGKESSLSTLGFPLLHRLAET